MKTDTWNPAQYLKFKTQRSQPFWDLADLVRPDGVRTILDLGCGTGELTAGLYRRFPGAETLGIDNSDAMLAESAAFAAPGLRFEKRDIASYEPAVSFDLVFSNAALQWVPDHDRLFPRIFHTVAPRGQIAIQMPCNFDHPSHRIARLVAQDFLKDLDPAFSDRTLFSLERYAEMLFRNGFEEQSCRLQVYPHPMPSGADVVEWTKGTLLTSYQKHLPPDVFTDFVARYRERLLAEIGTGPYLYTFKRMLLWGRRRD